MVIFQNQVWHILFEAACRTDRYDTNFKKIGWKMRQCGPKNWFCGAVAKSAESLSVKNWKSCNFLIWKAIETMLVSIYMFLRLINLMKPHKILKSPSKILKLIYFLEKLWLFNHRKQLDRVIFSHVLGTRKK